MIRLRSDKKPQTVLNFWRYVNSGFYAGTIFHYAFPNLVLEGGGYLPFAPGEPRVLKATNPPIGVEDDRTNHLSNLRWTVTMVQFGSQGEATSQISINLEDNTFRDNFGGLTPVVFGIITSGTEVVAAMASAPCTPIPGVRAAGLPPSAECGNHGGKTDTLARSLRFPTDGHWTS